MNSFLSRLMPRRLQTRLPLVDEERLKLLSQVSEHDPCLRAVLDIGQEQLESEFHAAIDPERPAEQRLRACDGMRLAYYTLQRIESERASAREWREREEARQERQKA